MPKTVTVPCPNCGRPAEREDRQGVMYVICGACDATYKIDRMGPATVEEVGRFEALEDRVSRLEGRPVAPSPAEKPVADPAREKDDHANDPGSLTIGFSDDDD